PEFSTVYSNTFVYATFVFGFSFSQQDSDFQKQSANIQVWQANVDLPELDSSIVVDNRTDPAGYYYFPKDIYYSIEDVERERT
ncbi:hypothetical protein V6257_20210, partial [Pseudoalteromonas issachenkonii]